MIRSISNRRAQDWKLYEAVKLTWRKHPANQRCCVSGCDQPAEKDPHHILGRTTTLLYDARWFAPICWPHHERVKADPVWARSVGLAPPLPGMYGTPFKMSTSEKLTAFEERLTRHLIAQKTSPFKIGELPVAEDFGLQTEQEKWAANRIAERVKREIERTA